MRPASRWAFVLGCLLLTGCVAEQKEQDKPRAKDENPPAVRKAECRWATNVIRVNGILDDVAWDDAQPLTDFSAFWLKRKPATKTTARLLWDRSYLYFCADMEDLDLFALTKERNG